MKRGCGCPHIAEAKFHFVKDGKPHTLVDATIVVTRPPDAATNEPRFARDEVLRLNTSMSIVELEQLHKRVGEILDQARDFQQKRAEGAKTSSSQPWYPARVRRNPLDRTPVDMVQWSYVVNNSDLAPRVLMGDELLVSSIKKPTQGSFVVVADASGHHKLRVYHREPWHSEVTLGFARPGRDPEPLLPTERIIGVAFQYWRCVDLPPWDSGFEWVERIQSEHLGPDIVKGSTLLLSPKRTPAKGDVVMVDSLHKTEFLRVHQAADQRKHQALLVVDPALGPGARLLREDERINGTVVEHWIQ